MGNYSDMPTLMAAIEYLPKKQKVMEKERKITAPEGYEIEKIEIIDADVAVVTFKEKELPKSWDEFYEMTGIKIPYNLDKNIRGAVRDNAIAEAVLALIKLIQLRNCYNGDWVPDWNNESEKFIIGFYFNYIETWMTQNTASVLYFKTQDLRDEFLRNFRPLIEKLKPLYGIKGGGEE